MEKESYDNNNYSNFQLPIICDADTLQILIREKTVRIVDVRKEQEYQQEHIPTAVSIPLAQLLKKDTPEEVVNLMQNAGISNKMPVVVYDDTFGALAARVAWTFQYVGHTNTALLEVTFSRWKDLELEVEKQINSYAKLEHSLNVNDQIHADSSYVDAIKEQPNKILLDSRERLNFLTEH